MRPKTVGYLKDEGFLKESKEHKKVFDQTQNEISRLNRVRREK